MSLTLSYFIPRKTGLPYRKYGKRSPHNQQIIYHDPDLFPGFKERFFNWVFKKVDAFFQGKNEESFMNLPSSAQNQSFAVQVEWDLRQDYLDIAQRDVSVIYHAIAPVFLRTFLTKLNQYRLLIFYTDELLNENIYDTDLQLISSTILNKNDKHFLLLDKVSRIGIGTKNCCLRFVKHWKSIVHSVVYLVNLLKDTWNPSGSQWQFLCPSPMFSILPDLKIRGPGWFKLNPAFSFHKRI